MIPGKKIQNYITFQTKDTIFLKQNQPEFIVHEQTIETDSFKCTSHPYFRTPLHQKIQTKKQSFSEPL